MTLINDEFVGLTYDCALDRIMAMASAEEQAQALLRHDCLLNTKRGDDLMRKIAGPSSPGCQRLSEIVGARDAESAVKKAERVRRKALPKTVRFVPPSLFDAFGAAPLEDTE